jgi:hypothetical protein
LLLLSPKRASARFFLPVARLITPRLPTPSGSLSFGYGEKILCRKTTETGWT